MWHQAKEIIRKCPTCSLYNQTPLPAGSNPKGTQRNEIWQIDVFHFVEFGKLKYVHHTIDTYSDCQWVIPLSLIGKGWFGNQTSARSYDHIHVQIKTDNAPAYMSCKTRGPNNFTCTYWNVGDFPSPQVLVNVLQIELSYWIGAR